MPPTPLLSARGPRVSVEVAPAVLVDVVLEDGRSRAVLTVAGVPTWRWWAGSA